MPRKPGGPASFRSPTPATHCINLVAGSSLDAAGCPWRMPSQHTREDTGAFVTSLLRPPARASFVGSAPATGSLGSERPETSRGPIRLAHVEQATGTPFRTRAALCFPSLPRPARLCATRLHHGPPRIGADGLCLGVLTGREIGLAEIPGTVPESDHARSRDTP